MLSQDFILGYYQALPPGGNAAFGRPAQVAIQIPSFPEGEAFGWAKK